MAILVSEEQTDFGFGAVDSAAPTRMPRNAVSAMINARMQPDGLPQRRSGNIRTHSAALNSGALCYGGTKFRTAAGTDMQVAIFGDKAYESTDKGATWTAITGATGLHLDFYSFATMRVGAVNYLFAANGDTTIKRYDGSTWDTVPNAPSGVKYIAPFNGRLWATGHSGVLVQACKIADPTTWSSPDGITVQVLAAPTGMMQVGPDLLVWDRDTTSQIDGYGEQTIVVAVGATGFSNSVGLIAFRSAVPVGDAGAAWLSERGLEYYVSGSGIVLVSKNVQVFLKSLDLDQLYANPGRPCALFDPDTQDYICVLSTGSSRNNRALVLNLLQQTQWQRQGPRAAAAVDQYVTPAGSLLFGGDAQGYLTVDPNGVQLDTDGSGYAQLGVAGGAGDAIGVDGSGYLLSVTNDALPASIWIAPATGQPSTMYSGGYDGFVRRHYGASADDVLADGTGGTPVTMTVISRPFFVGRDRQRKRVRAAHVAVIATAGATLTVRPRGDGVTGAPRTITVPASPADQSVRRKAMVYLNASDAPQIRVDTTDDAKIALIGISAEMLREPV